MSQAPSLDWFQPALHSELSVSQGLDRVLAIEESRVQFVRCLKIALNHQVPGAPDRLAIIQQDIRTLAQTLRHRLGFLSIDKPQAWFRHSPPTERGPFATAILEDPVFLRFDEGRASAVRHHIPELWRSRQMACEAFEPGSSLWGRILGLNRNLARINQLSAPYADLCLDELPEALPDELLSPALQRFCASLSQRMRVCQQELQDCYQALWAQSESFLYAMHLQYMSRRAREQQVPKRSSPVDEALRFMSFTGMPDVTSLRQRYRQLAQTYHPDRGGSAERFQLLTRHYEVIMRALPNSASIRP